MALLDEFKKDFDKTIKISMTLEDYLKGCKKDPSMYKTAAERMLDAIGEPELVDTSKDSRLSRVFSNRVVKIYPAWFSF